MSKSRVSPVGRATKGIYFHGYGIQYRSLQTNVDEDDVTCLFSMFSWLLKPIDYRIESS